MRIAWMWVCLMAIGCSTEEPPSRAGKSKAKAANAESENTDSDKVIETESENEEPRVETQAVEETELPSLDWADVEFRFVSPDADSDHDTGEIVVEVDTGKFVGGEFGLYYNQAFHSLDGAQAIAEDLDPKTKEVTWDTSDLEPGTYFLFAILERDEQMNVQFFKGTVNLFAEPSADGLLAEE